MNPIGRVTRLLVALAVPAAMASNQPAWAADPGVLSPGDAAVVSPLPVERALLDLTNADRVANGLEPLELDTDTLAIARERAADELDAPSLSHVDADGQLIFAELLAKAQLSYRLAGENLARTYIQDAGLIQRVEQGLMQSPSHRKNILEPMFKRVAIGAATDTTGRIAFAEVYRD